MLLLMLLISITGGRPNLFLRFCFILCRCSLSVWFPPPPRLFAPQLVSELATQTAEQEKLSSQQAEAAERFGFFQQTRNALSDLCGMLREKVCAECLVVFAFYVPPPESVVKSMVVTTNPPTCCCNLHYGSGPQASQRCPRSTCN